VAEVSQCTRSLGVLTHRRAAFLKANALMQNDPNELTEAMRDCSDSFVVSEAQHQTTIDDLKNAAFCV